MSPNTDVIMDNDGYVGSASITRVSSTQFQLSPGVYDIKAYVTRVEFLTPYASTDQCNLYIFNHSAGAALSLIPVIQGFTIDTITAGIQKFGCTTRSIIRNITSPVNIGLRAIEVSGTSPAIVNPSLVIKRLG
jgi:hypothetical protein